MTLLLIFLLSAMLISFLCSTLESCLMSTPLTYILMREEEGFKPASLFKTYKTETEKPLAAILSLNTIANTIGAAGVGMQATEVFGSEWFGLVSAITTILILIFSEIIPKTIGTTYWKNLMGFTANTIKVLIILMFPHLSFPYLTSMFVSLLMAGFTTVYYVRRRHQMTYMGEAEEPEKKVEEMNNGKRTTDYINFFFADK